MVGAIAFQVWAESRATAKCKPAALITASKAAWPPERVKYGYADATKHAGKTALRVIFDTSLLVAATRSREGASFQLLSMLPSRDFEIALTVALYTEWQSVLTRPEHLPPGATVESALAFLRYLASLAYFQDVHFLWRPFLRDPNDDMVLECAVASGSRFIVTHNIKGFRRSPELKVQAITPAEFLTILRSKS